MIPELSDRDLALGMLRDHNTESQLLAVRRLLSLHREADMELSAEIKQLGEQAKQASGQQADYLVHEWVDNLHYSVFQDAAHSMAAVGMLAPLLESLFVAVFQLARTGAVVDTQTYTAGPRAQSSGDDFWDPHNVFNGAKKKQRDLVAGIDELSGAVGLAGFLPTGCRMTLEALFAYRNKMFHCGFEWPMKERLAFDERIQRGKWPTDWFLKSMSDGSPWIFYMSRGFIQHCLKTIDEILDGVGAFLRQLPPCHTTKMLSVLYGDVGTRPLGSSVDSRTKR